MWSDTLQSLERMHMLRLILWGGTSVLSSSILLTVLAIRRIRAPLIAHFAIQSLAWGAIDLAWGGIAYGGVPLRDLSGATDLARTLWFAIGLEVGCIGIGVTLAVAGWRWGKRLGALGAGFGVVVQSAALVLLDSILARGIRL